jgi:hypothetical protein
MGLSPVILARKLMTAKLRQPEDGHRYIVIVHTLTRGFMNASRHVFRGRRTTLGLAHGAWLYMTICIFYLPTTAVQSDTMDG